LQKLVEFSLLHDKSKARLHFRKHKHLFVFCVEIFTDAHFLKSYILQVFLDCCSYSYVLTKTELKSLSGNFSLEECYLYSTCFLQEHVVRMVVKLLSPPLPSDSSTRGSMSHYLSQMSTLNAILLCVSYVDAVHILSLYGMVSSAFSG
jgi:hypothetical protein